MTANYQRPIAAEDGTDTWMTSVTADDDK